MRWERRTHGSSFESEVLVFALFLEVTDPLLVRDEFCDPVEETRVKID